MANYCSILDKHRGGWTLIVLLIVVAIIALLMILYLPSVLQSYSPPTTTDKQGEKKPVIEHVKEELAPIENRNQELEKYLPKENKPESNQPQNQNR